MEFTIVYHNDICNTTECVLINIVTETERRVS